MSAAKAGRKAAVKKSASKATPLKGGARKPLRRTIRGGRPMFFDDPAIDKVFNMVVTLSGEVWILRERLAAMEALQVKGGALKKGQLDAFDFDAESEATLATQRKEFIDNLFRILNEHVQKGRPQL